MRLHERERQVSMARIDLVKAWLDIQEKHDLTQGECLSVLASFVGTDLGLMAKFMIRQERHGDPDKPGGLALDDEDEEE